MKKKLLCLSIILSIFFIIFSPFDQKPSSKILKELGIDNTSTYEFSYVTETHSGFHNDGTTYYIFENLVAPNQQRFNTMDGWHTFPLNLGIACIIYGGIVNNTYYHRYINFIPPITDGYWFFKDFQRPQNEYSTEDILKVYTEPSANFAVAIWDSEQDILYYARFDS